jgi:uncharacterized protein (DUF433 family)
MELQGLVDIGGKIVQTPGTCGGRPRIEGTRITVRWVVTWDRAGLSPEEIVERFPHLSVAQIYVALAYYQSNKGILDAAFAREEEEERRLELEAGAAKKATA